jgi:putative transposase
MLIDPGHNNGISSILLHRQAKHRQISIRKQCELIGLNRSSLYYKPEPESEEDIKAKTLIDEIYTDKPFFGYRKMTVFLKQKGLDINHKRVSRLMNEMGIQAVYPKRNLSKANMEHRIYPYLLRDVEITAPDQVWSSDITYIRMKKGFIYLAAVMDWHSRHVLSWSVSNTMDVHFCIEALNKALVKGTPEIFNTDQGSQFTSDAFTSILVKNSIQISMDSRGRVFDNIFIERLWRSLKYEEVYLKEYETVKEAVRGISRYFDFYNNERPHQSLGYRTPAEEYYGQFLSAVNF